MKKNELRIGNWLNGSYNGFSKDVQIYDFDREVIQHSDEHQLPIPFSNFKPIPLTEQWLIDFGFKDSKLKKRYHKILYKNWINSNKDLGAKYKRFYFYIEKTNSRFSIDSDFRKYIDIKYVHQLQNLYFALTGEELTKPSKSSNAEK